MSLVLTPQRADGEPYTTSEIIAEGTGINHRRVRDAIRKYQTELETFGRVGAYQTPLETNGGTQTVPGYLLNEQQATFLLTLLKNTPVVVAFKKELVRQFYAMRDELARRHLDGEQRAFDLLGKTGRPGRQS
jgi:phage regulator Rha-like protein